MHENTCLRRDMTKSVIKVLIVDDHPIVRNGLRRFLEIEDDIVIVGEAEDGISCIECVEKLKPDVVLLDLVMPRMEGIEAIRKIKEISAEIRIVVLTSYHQDAMVIPALKAGALSYLLKNSSPEDILEALRAAMKSEARLHPGIVNRLMHDICKTGRPFLDALTARELEILKLIAKGLSNRGISDKLTISEKTVKSHVSSILSKLYLSDRTQAAIFALQHGIVPIDDIPSY